MAKIMISLPDAFLKKVDRIAKAEGRSRSELIREALRGMLTGKKSASRGWKDALAPLEKLEEQWVGRWDSTDIIRYYRETRSHRHSPSNRANSSRKRSTTATARCASASLKSAEAGMPRASSP